MAVVGVGVVVVEVADVVVEEVVETALMMMGFLVGAATVDSVCRSWVLVMVVDQTVWSVMVHQSVQTDQMNPTPLVVHLPAPVIQTFVFQLDRRLSLEKTVETALRVMGVLVGAATVDSVWRSYRSVMVSHIVQTEKMNPHSLVVHLTAPVIQTFVFHLETRFSPKKTVETALNIIYMGILVGAATWDSVCIRSMSVMVNHTVQMDQMNP